MAEEEQYQKVANRKDLKEVGLLKIEPNRKSIISAMVIGNVYAVDSICSHKGGPLAEGSLGGYNLTCHWHYAVFDIRNATSMLRMESPLWCFGKWRGGLQ